MSTSFQLTEFTARLCARARSSGRTTDPGRSLHGRAGQSACSRAWFYVPAVLVVLFAVASQQDQAAHVWQNLIW